MGSFLEDHLTHVEGQRLAQLGHLLQLVGGQFIKYIGLPQEINDLFHSQPLSPEHHKILVLQLEITAEFYNDFGFTGEKSTPPS
jgi:hypothetical protein